MTREKLLSDIEQFAKSNNLAPATVTSRAVGNSRLYQRLKSGRSCTLGVANRLAEFMVENAAKDAA